MTCQRIGRYPMGTIGLGVFSAYSRNRIPRPPQKRTTFIGCTPPRLAQTMPWRSSCVYLHFGNRHDKFSTPVSSERKLADDFIFQVPGEDKDIIGAGRSKFLSREDRNMGAGQELAMLIRISIYRKFQEIRADPAIIEQGIAFARGAIADYFFPFTSNANQEIKQLTFGFFHVLAKREIAFKTIEAIFLFANTQRVNRVRNGFAGIIRMTSVNT